jgi:hypothetical protein
MIVFDLKCTTGHVFEAWFASSDAFQDQKARSLLSCPMCGASDIDKAVMAPNVPTKGNQRPEAGMNMVSDAPAAPAEMKAMMTKIAAVQAEIIKNSQWVGRDFAQKARAMDAGVMDHALIHGQTSADEARELLEDGISVMPLLIPVVPPEKQN